MKYVIFIFFSSFFIPINAQSIEFFNNNRLILGTYKELTASMGIGDIDGDGDPTNDIGVNGIPKYLDPEETESNEN